MNISFIIPSRDNLKYLKWSYAAIRKNQGDHNVEICVADDFSSDGTWAWCVETEKEDPNFKWIRNMGPTRVGHTILYDRLVKECASHEMCIIYHADMYLCPGALDAIEKHMYYLVHHDFAPNGFEKAPIAKTIVSLTRIEPPLHPSGPEKITRDFGTEPELFDEEAFLKDLQNHSLHLKDKTTAGVFAPWAFFKKDFLEIGGHDPLFAPQSKEDSDIFNRFKLNGVDFIQTWEGFVYHMTCRGSRFNPTITEVGKNSSEWELQNLISSRNFVRKWGSFISHDEYMMPIIPPKYDLEVALYGKIPEEAQGGVLPILEPWCPTLITSLPEEVVQKYIEVEQPNTPFDLTERIFSEPLRSLPEVRLEADVAKLGQVEIGYLQQINAIVENYITSQNLPYPVTGSFSLGNWLVDLNIQNPPSMRYLIKDVQGVNWKTESIYNK